LGLKFSGNLIFLIHISSFRGMCVCVWGGCVFVYEGVREHMNGCVLHIHTYTDIDTRAHTRTHAQREREKERERERERERDRERERERERNTHTHTSRHVERNALRSMTVH